MRAFVSGLYSVLSLSRWVEEPLRASAFRPRRSSGEVSSFKSGEGEGEREDSILRWLTSD